MNKATILIKKKFILLEVVFVTILLLLIVRVAYIQVHRAEELQTLAYEQQTRDRLISANRGEILDRNMNKIATIETVATVSVINAQVENPEEVSRVLSEKLELDYDYVYNKVTKRVALERVKSKVDKATADEIRALGVSGIMVDEDTKRVYPYSTLASQVIGFVGRDNQGIVGLEAKYDEALKGAQGKIMTETDATGDKMPNGKEERKNPVDGNNLVTSIDVVIQQYAEQALDLAMQTTNAKRSAIIVMNPNNGEILAMANKPDFDLNEPFEINDEELKLIWDSMSSENQNNELNKMWRNFTINDTYEPGSTFKIITSVAGLEEGVVDENTGFVCNGHTVVGNVRIKCWRSPRAHGALNFVEGVKQSCNAECELLLG